MSPKELRALIARGNFQDLQQVSALGIFKPTW